MVQRGGRRGPWLPDHLVQAEALPLHIPCLLGVCPLPFPPARSAPVSHAHVSGVLLLCQPLFHLFILCHFILNDHPMR